MINYQSCDKIYESYIFKTRFGFCPIPVIPNSILIVTHEKMPGIQKGQCVTVATLSHATAYYKLQKSCTVIMTLCMIVVVQSQFEVGLRLYVLILFSIYTSQRSVKTASTIVKTAVHTQLLTHHQRYDRTLSW